MPNWTIKGNRNKQQVSISQSYTAWHAQSAIITFEQLCALWMSCAIYCISAICMISLLITHMACTLILMPIQFTISLLHIHSFGSSPNLSYPMNKERLSDEPKEHLCRRVIHCLTASLAGTWVGPVSTPKIGLIPCLFLSFRQESHTGRMSVPHPSLLIWSWPGTEAPPVSSSCRSCAVPPQW